MTVDDDTLRILEGEPLVFWAPHYAQAIKTLRDAGVRAIGIDFLFSVSADSWLRQLGVAVTQSVNHDGTFREQLYQGDVVLAAVIDSKGKPRLPVMDYLAVIPGFPDVRAQVGLVNVDGDSDGVIRSFSMTPYQVDPPQQQARVRQLLNFAPLLALRSAGGDIAATSWNIAGRTRYPSRLLEPIGFAGPPGTIPRVSLGALLEPDAVRETSLSFLKNKVAIIGMEYAANQDVHATPYSGRLFNGSASLMSGIELHANIVETLLGNTAPRHVSDPIRLAFVVGLVSTGLFLFVRIQAWHGLVAALLLTLLAAAGSFGAFTSNWILPAGQVQVSIVAGYLAVLGLRLTAEERERSRLRELFGRYVSDDIVETLLSSAGKLQLGGEEVVATALFSDVRNYSAYSDRLGPAKTMDLLNAHWGRICDAILTNGGTIFSFTGDEVFALFGAPIQYPDHALRAIRAALEIQDVTRSYTESSREAFERKNLPAFAIGVGLHTGKVLVGTMGFARRTEYTAIGETVNTAARLEKLNKTLGWDIVASQSTVDSAGPSVVIGGQKTIQVAGRQAPVGVFRIDGVRD